MSARREREVLVEQAAGAWRPVRVDGSVGALPAWADLDEAGRVTAARVVQPAGNGFDEVAVEQARRCTFSPAIRGGRPQAVRYPFPVKFRLDE